jgi:hypothetical protein
MPSWALILRLALRSRGYCISPFAARMATLPLARLYHRKINNRDQSVDYLEAVITKLERGARRGRVFVERPSLIPVMRRRRRRR